MVNSQARRLVPRFPKMLLGNGAHETALDEIIGPGHVPGQRPRIAPQARDLLFKQRSESFIGKPIIVARPRRQGSTAADNVEGRCNRRMNRGAPIREEL